LSEPDRGSSGAAATDVGAGTDVAAARAAQFRQVILPQLDAAYSLARFLTRDAVAAQDVAQEAMLRAWRAFGSYRGGDARSWVLTIVRNCSYNWLEAQRRERTVPVSEVPEPLADPVAAPEASVTRESEAQRLRALIAALPEPYRETLVLRELEDLSYKQIAAITGAPIGTVMSRLARARAMLGAQLEPRP
jgi:RNA polymerase sigma factor (sigma-70 family)